MTGKTKCYDHTQDTISMALVEVKALNRRDGYVDPDEARTEALLEEAARSARYTATFVRGGIRFLGGGGINRGLLVDVRAVEREMQSACRGRTEQTECEGENQAA